MGPRLDSNDRAAVRYGGVRKYTDPRKGGREAIDILIKNLDVQMQGLADDDRMPFPLREVGYTHNAERRIIDQHKKHASSNIFMNLFEAICMVDPALKVYEMQGHVVFLCSKRVHVSCATCSFAALR